MKADPNSLYKMLALAYGIDDPWWPGDTPFEIFVSAILVQRTQWRNVELAMENLRVHKLLSINAISKAAIPKLEEAVKPAGFYKQKARRLKGICASINAKHGSLEALFALDTTSVVSELLSYYGIGDETADAIALFAGNKPTFVIDAYTRRIMHRVYGIDEFTPYVDLKHVFENAFPRNPRTYKRSHALLVEHAKRKCTKRNPLCGTCALSKICRYHKNGK